MATVAPDFRKQDHAHLAGIRRLVLHADDFGMNAFVNAGILRAFSHGVLTSTSVLTNAPGCASALLGWKELQSRVIRADLPSHEARRRLVDSLTPFDLGVHLNLTQGRPLTGKRYPAPLLDTDGLFPGVFRLARRLATSGRQFRQAIEEELCAQVEVLLTAGISPTHLNAHQYIDILPIVAGIIPRLLQRYAIPVTRVPWETHLNQTTLLHRFEPANWCLAQVKRMFAFHHSLMMRRRGFPHPDRFFGTSHAGRIDLTLMETFVTAAGRGVTEIGMHPGSYEPVAGAAESIDGWGDPLTALRSAELALLTSDELVELLESRQVHLVRLSDLALHRVAFAAA